MLSIIVVLTAITQGLVGLFVYQKKKDSLSNILFGILSLVSLGWAAVNYFYTLNPTSDSALQIIRTVILFVVLQNTIFYLFAQIYPSNKSTIPVNRLMIYLFFSLIVAFASISPFVFSSVTVADGQSNPNPGPLIPLFMVHALFSIGVGLKSLARKVKKSQGQQKKQLKFILFASILNWVLVPITNFVITLVFHTTFFAKVSPFYTLAFASIIAYAIVTQKLFDIRAAVARSVTYVLLLGVLAGFYGFVVIGVIDVVFADQSYVLLRRVLTVILVIFIALSFENIRKIVSKATNKIFFQDAYDPQQLIDSLNKVFVSNVELETLLTQTNTIIENNLKAEYSTFLINKTAYDPDRWIGGNYHLKETEVVHLNEMLTKSQSKVIVAEYLDDNDELRKFLLDNNIAVLARLVPRIDYELPGIGLLVLGPKKSGNLYSTQDSRVLEIIANELVIAVENALRFEEIEKFNITLQQKVDKATSELRATNKKLVDLDEAKDEFISMASHQLRTPLTSMKGYVSMVLEGDAGKISAMQKKLLDQAFVSSQRMVYLIADLLNVSRLKTGKFIIEAKPTNLAQVVEEEIGQLIETAKGRNLELTYDKPKEFPLLMLDETKIRQVIMNFADNAIYYTPSGGHIKVNLLDKKDTVEFTVVDDGLGVPKAEQHHLFNKFYRAGNAKKARPDGTGLGLFMAKKVIVAQGGAIIFSSTEGKGSTFGFSFSKAKLTPTPEQLKATTPSVSTVPAIDAPEISETEESKQTEPAEAKPDQVKT